MVCMSSSEAQLDNIGVLPKSTVVCVSGLSRCRIVTRVWGSAVLLIALLSVGGSASAGQTAAQPKPVQMPVGTMSELMIKIIYPASDAVFYISTRTPQDSAGWTELEGKTLMLAEAGNLLMMPAHQRDEDRWMNDARLMRDAGAAAYKAAKAKDVKALDDLNDALYQSCVTCHQHYRRNYGRGR